MNSKEKEAFNKIKKTREGHGLLIVRTATERMKVGEIYHQYPALSFYESLFPNNFIDTKFLEKTKNEFISNFGKLQSIINDTKSSERDILNFIRDNEFYLGIATLIKNRKNWGHHQVFVFREFQLGSEYIVDFLIVGNNSQGYFFLFIELENINGSVTTKKSMLGDLLRKGIEQTKLWDYWLESNFQYLKTLFLKKTKDNTVLPNEFCQLDKTRLSYMVIGGRRSNFDSISNRHRRKLNQESNIEILHYDNLLDSISEFIDEGYL